MPAQVKHIRVAVVGGTGTGKTTLVAHINRRYYNRPLDHSHFQFHASECQHFTIDLWKDFELVLVTFSLDEGAGLAQETGKDIANSASRRGLVCIVGTKLDLLQRDYSELDLESVIYPNYFAYFYRLHFFAVSCSKDIGVEELLLSITNEVYPTPSHLARNSSPAPFLRWKRIAAWFLDMVAAIFALPVSANVNQQTPDSHELDDTAVDTLIKTPECKSWDDALSKYACGIFLGVPAHKITPTLIAKVVYPSEYANMEYVRKHTKIPVPQPRYPHISSWLVMDFVKGKMLLECWDSLNLFMKFRIACTLRGYISQLRTLRGSVPGTVAGGIVTGLLFDDEFYGPFESATTFRQFCEIAAHDGWKFRIRHPIPGQPHPPHPVFGGEWSLVFTHTDLNLSNILLSDDGVLWIIDWATSGFYPSWLESMGMKIYEERAPSSWRRLRWFIAGRNPQYEEFWGYLMTMVNRYRSFPPTFPEGHLGITPASDGA